MRRKHISLLIWLVGIPVILYALVKYGFWWKVREELDKFVKDSAEHAQIRYVSLATDPLGEIDISGIEVIPLGAAAPITIHQIHLETPNALELLWQQLPFVSSSRIPRRLAAEIRQVRVPLSGYYLKQLGADDEASATSCLSQRQGPQLLRLGFDELLLSGEMRMRYLEEGGALSLNLSWEANNVERMGVDVSLTGVTDQMVTGGMALMPSLQSASLQFSVQKDFGGKLMGACVGEGQDMLQLIETELQQIDAGLQPLGLSLAFSARNALQSFYTKWGSIELRALPLSPVPLMGLLLLKPNQWEERLGISLLRDGLPLPGPYFVAASSTAPILMSPGTAEQAEPEPEPEPQYRFEYRAVSPAALSGHLGRQVRITTREGLSRSGRLYAAGSDEVSVETRLSGGRMVAHVAMRDIQAVEVRIPVRIEPETEPEQGSDAPAAPEGEGQQEQTGQTEQATQQSGG